MLYSGRVVGAKIFVEEMLTVGGTEGVLKSTYCSGRLREIKNFKSISFSNSASLEKSFNITLSNPGNFMTTSQVRGRGVNKLIPTDDELQQNAKYVSDLYQKGVRPFSPFDSSQRDPNEKYRKVALQEEIIYGLGAEASDLSLFDAGQPYLLGEMQRIWVVLKTEFDDNRPARYTLIGGIITGFAEGYSYTGDTHFTINCAGFSRLLDLTRIHTKMFFGTYYKTQSEIFNEKILFPLLGTRIQAIGLMASLGPVGCMLYSAWVTNAMFSWLGRVSNYNENSLKGIPLTGAGIYPGMFYQLPIWLLNNNVPVAPQSVVTALKSLSDATDIMDKKEALRWRNKLEVMFDGKTADKYLPPRSALYDHRTALEDAARALYNGDTSINAAHLLPKVFYDDLIRALYSNDDNTGLQLFEKRIASQFELFTVSAMSAREILDKMAQAAMAVIREDDQGNLIFELPRYWEAPALTSGPGNHITIPEYDKWMRPAYVTIDPDAPDYILDGANFKAMDGSVSEANVVTHVEAPAAPQFIEMTEQIQNLIATGYSGQMLGEKNQRKEYIKLLERRYGFRSFTTPPIYSNGMAFKDDNKNAVRLKAAMNLFADAVLDLKNYARMQNTLHMIYSPWIDCNRNVLWMDRGELWMITNKTISYIKGETSGEASLVLSGSHGHYLSERVGYPYLDAVVKAAELSDDVSRLKNDIVGNIAEIDIINPSEKQANIEPQDAYDNVIYEACQVFQLPWDMCKALFMHESQGMKDPTTTSPSGAFGFAQIFPPAVADVKKRWSSLKDLDMYKPSDNIWLGVGYLKLCLERCGDKKKDSRDANVYFGLTAYNRGINVIGKSYDAAVKFYKRPLSQEESSKWLIEKFPTKDKWNNPAGDGFARYVAGQFQLTATPARKLWDALKISANPPSGDEYPWWQFEQEES